MMDFKGNIVHKILAIKSRFKSILVQFCCLTLKWESNQLTKADNEHP